MRQYEGSMGHNEHSGKGLSDPRIDLHVIRGPQARIPRGPDSTKRGAGEHEQFPELVVIIPLGSTKHENRCRGYAGSGKLANVGRKNTEGSTSIADLCNSVTD